VRAPAMLDCDHALRRFLAHAPTAHQTLTNEIDSPSGGGQRCHPTAVRQRSHRGDHFTLHGRDIGFQHREVTGATLIQKVGNY
jgi:hypothetical protein